MEYYFQDNLRWSLGWETPNQAGAFLAMLLPLCWLLIGCLWVLMGGTSSVSSESKPGGPHGGGPSLNPLPRVRQGRLLRFAFLQALLITVAVEIWLWWALAKTYSRGAWVGVMCGAGVGCVLALARKTKARTGEPTTSSAQPRRCRRVSIGGLAIVTTLARVAVVIACLFASNFSARLSPDYTLADRSALNRVDLWKGGLELIVASPLRGWGWGESGAAYMQWTQPLDRTEGYKSMVNSYLTVAVEAGLPLFALLLTVMLLPLGLGLGLARSCFGWRLPIALGLTACWATWLGCLFFSNLWIIPKLWIIPGVSAVVLVAWAWAKVGRALRARREQSTTLAWESARETVMACLGAAMATAMGVAIGAWIIGLVLVRSTSLQLTREPSGIVRLQPRGKAWSNWLEVYPDAAVLGESYGHELRRWLLVSANPQALRIQSPFRAVSLGGGGHSAVIFGEQVMKASLADRRVCLVHPVGLVPSDISGLATGSRVVLAGIDPTGGRYAWEAWAQERGATVVVNEGLAADVRLRWPAIIDRFAQP